MLRIECFKAPIVFLRLSDEDEVETLFMMTDPLNIGRLRRKIAALRGSVWVGEVGFIWGLRCTATHKKESRCYLSLKPHFLRGSSLSSLHAQSKETIYLFTKII